jgi:mannose/fructose/N-acetylgalactosamine-specific phosphotransferase system component IIC
LDIFRIALVGGIVALDTTAAFQIMISQPLIGGLMAGWALGDPWLGAFIGLLFQGLYLAELPIGARIFPDSNLGTVQAAALTVFLRHDVQTTLGLAILLGFFWSIPASIFGGQIIVWMRKLHGRYLPTVDRLVFAGRQGAINLLYLAVILENFLVGAALTVVLYLAGRIFMTWLAGALPGQGMLAEWGMALRGGLLGAGCAVIFMTLVGRIAGFKRWIVLVAVILAVGFWVIGY